MAVARPYGSKIDFMRNPIFGSAARFFVFILKFIFALIYELKIFEKKILDTKIISFSKAVGVNNVFLFIIRIFDLSI